MNTANVEALAALIREVDGNHALGAGALAEALAARGALVPSAVELPPYFGGYGAEVLEGIARGEIDGNGDDCV